MENVCVIGVGMTPFGKLANRGVKDLTRQSVEAVLKDAGCESGDLEGAFFANAVQDHMARTLNRGEMRP